MYVAICAYAAAPSDPGAAGGIFVDMYWTKSPTVPPAQFILNCAPRSAGPNCPLSARGKTWSSQ
jgi:hypothetical protein